MAQGKNKPDLSDLKARLGLKKQGAAKDKQDSQEPAEQQAGPAAQPSATGPQADGPGPAAGPAGAQAPQGGPAQAGPRQGGPPPGAQGPPPGAQGPPPGAQGPPPGAQRGPASRPQAQSTQPSGPSARSQAASTASASTSSAATSRKPAADIELDDEDLKAAGGSTFSPAAVILMVGLLLVGVIFGWVASSSMQNREVYNARSEDAARIHGKLEEKVAKLDEAKKLLAKLKPEPGEADYKINKQLADLEIAPDGNLLGGNRLLLGPQIIDSVTSYTTDASMLEQMLDEHERQTKADREEIEQLVAGNEVVKKDYLAVLFDYDYLAGESGSDDYTPKGGRLVNVTSVKKDKNGKMSFDKDENGKVEVELLGTDRTIKTRIQGIIPLPKGDVMKTGGQNALQRYQARVARIQRQMLEFEQYRKSMMESLEKLANKDSAPLLNF